MDSQKMTDALFDATKGTDARINRFVVDAAVKEAEAYAKEFAIAELEKAKSMPVDWESVHSEDQGDSMVDNAVSQIMKNIDRAIAALKGEKEDHGA